MNDEVTYHQLAVNLIEHSSFSTAAAPPYYPTVWRVIGYPLFLAAVHTIFGDSLLAVRVLNFVFLWMTCVFLYLFVKRFFSTVVAFTSAILCALYIPFVVLSFFQLTETISTSLFVLIAYLITKAPDIRKHKILFYLFIGAVNGILILVRPSMMIFPFLLIAAVLIQKGVNTNWIKAHLPLAGALLFGCLLTVSPWGIRNFALTNQFFLGLGSGMSLYVSALQYNQSPDGEKLDQTYARLKGSVEEQLKDSDKSEGEKLILGEMMYDKLLRNAALEEFNKLSFAQIIKAVPGRFYNLWRVGDASGDSTFGNPDLQIKGLHTAAIAQYLLLAALILTGIFVNRNRLRVNVFLLMFPLYLTFIHFIFHAETRYTMLGRPFLLVYAGVGIIFVYEITRRKISPPYVKV